MNAKISLFVIYVETIIYTIYKLHNCAFNEGLIMFFVYSRIFF